MDLKCGVAGLGRGRQFVQIFDGLTACETVAVCDQNPKALEALPDKAGYADYDEFLKEKLDIVAVITPGPAHAEQSIKAMKSGAHVLCETPNVYSVEEAQRVLNAAAQTGRKYMLAENYLWNDWVLDAEQKINEGLLGNIIYAEGDYTHDCRDLMLIDENGYVPYAERGDHPNAQKSWRATDLPPLFYCSHTLAPLLQLMKDRVIAVTGLSAGSRTAPDIGAIDLEAALAETENGAVIRLTNGFTVAHPMSTFYSLVGTKGSVQYGSATGGDLLFYSDNDPEERQGWQNIPVTNRSDGKNSTERMVEAFAASIADNTPLPLDELRSMDMVLPGVLAHASAMQGGARTAVPDLCGKE